jgi:hypothetical protein
MAKSRKASSCRSRTVSLTPKTVAEVVIRLTEVGILMREISANMAVLNSPVFIRETRPVSVEIAADPVFIMIAAAQARLEQGLSGLVTNEDIQNMHQNDAGCVALGRRVEAAVLEHIMALRSDPQLGQKKPSDALRAVAYPNGPGVFPEDAGPRDSW